MMRNARENRDAKNPKYYFQIRVGKTTPHGPGPSFSASFLKGRYTIPPPS
jgi:hypothetical protein